MPKLRGGCSGITLRRNGPRVRELSVATHEHNIHLVFHGQHLLSYPPTMGTTFHKKATKQVHVEVPLPGVTPEPAQHATEQRTHLGITHQ